jgi:hypothetical protein
MIQNMSLDYPEFQVKTVGKKSEYLKSRLKVFWKKGKSTGKPLTEVIGNLKNRETERQQKKSRKLSSPPTPGKRESIATR